MQSLRDFEMPGPLAAQRRMVESIARKQRDQAISGRLCEFPFKLSAPMEKFDEVLCC
jgi:hypothetical protein